MYSNSVLAVCLFVRFNTDRSVSRSLYGSFMSWLVPVYLPRLRIKAGFFALHYFVTPIIYTSWTV